MASKLDRCAAAACAEIAARFTRVRAGVDAGFGDASVSEALRGVLLQQDWSSLSHLSGHLVTSFFAGGLILAAVATPCAYFFVLHLVRNYRRVRGIPDIREG